MGLKDTENEQTAFGKSNDNLQTYIFTRNSILAMQLFNDCLNSCILETFLVLKSLSLAVASILFDLTSEKKIKASIKFE